MKKSIMYSAGAVLVVVALVGGYGLGTVFPWHHRPAPVRHRHHTRPRVKFSLPNLAGQKRSLSHWPAKVYLVNFWAPWCPPCRAEVPLLIKTAQADKKLGLVVIGIALDRQKAVARFVKLHHIDYPVLIGGERGLQMLAQFGDMQGAIPFSLFVSPKGRILTGQLGAFDRRSLQATLGQVLKQR